MQLIDSVSIPRFSASVLRVLRVSAVKAGLRLPPALFLVLAANLPAHERSH